MEREDRTAETRVTSAELGTDPGKADLTIASKSDEEDDGDGADVDDDDVL